jgi:hypothetical protein
MRPPLNDDTRSLMIPHAGAIERTQQFMIEWEDMGAKPSYICAEQ